MSSKKYKICIVPACKAVNSNIPDRIFFPVPDDKKKQWLEIVGGDTDFIEPNKRLFCCENHFSTKRDIVGYHFYKVFGGRIKLEDHALPFKNLGDNISTPRSKLPVTIAIPETKENDEPVDFVEDPLATSIDKDVEHESGDESNGDLGDTGLDFSCADSDSDAEETKFDPSQLARSEEIIVTSDVYMHDNGNDSDSDSDSDNVPLKVKTEDQYKAGVFSNIKKERVENDDDTGTSKSGYKCLKCKKILSSSRSLKRHDKTFHVEETKKRTFSCPECQEIFMTYNDYQKHKSVHRKLHQCDVCDKSFRTRFRLKSHYVIHMKEKPFLCEICSRSFARATTLRTHKYTHVTEKKFVCDTCGKRFPAHFLLKQHITQYHTDAMSVMCAHCSKIFTSSAVLKIHINAHHSDINPYQCEICKLQFKHPSALLRHRKRFHDPRSSFPCELCPKNFTKLDMLERHMKTHRSKLIHSSEAIISPDGKSKCMLKVERKDRKPPEKVTLKCEECGITLCRPDRLKAHMAKLHNPENPYQCETCRQTFTTEILKNQHVMRSHAPEHEYIYKCYICPKKYNQEAALKRHVKLHTDPKRPVTCQLCMKTLGRPNRLKPHMRALHNPDNPFKCDVCHQTFREQKILDSHTTQMHEQTILCQYCNKSFGKHEGLHQHLRRNHSELFTVIKTIKSE